MMNTVNGKVIVVTGGGQGLGAAICKTLAADGATVIPVDVKQENLAKITAEIKASGGHAEGYQMNVADVNSVTEAIDQIIDQFGRIDAVINNAGIDFTMAIDEITNEQFNQVVNVNLIGPFNVSKALFSHFKLNGSGHIVNIASTASKRAWPNASAYHASKWGLLGLSHALHAELRKDNIKVTAIVAGGMQTPFILERFPDTPMDVLQDPVNVAETVKFVLCMPQASVIPEMMVVPMKETSWP
ncbi:MAG TPA: SDR family oxidoreductase [Segetibacter sp.]|jgi:NAD(P)-dependent dehydrogenase (short-subunit alcohol dehydrogenase family)